MLNHPTFEKLVQVRMRTMADAYRQQSEYPAVANLPFEDRFGLLVDAEYWSRHSNRLKWTSRRHPWQISTARPEDCWIKNS